MPKRCAYGTCKSDSRYPKSLEGGVVFCPFPKPKTQEEKCKVWIKQCGRPRAQLNPSKINKNTFVCSKHFVNGHPTSEYPNPIAYYGAAGSRKHQTKGTRNDEQVAPQACTSKPTEDTASQNPAGDTASRACDSNTETHHDPDNGEALETLKKTLAEQKQEMLNLKMELQAKDSQIQLLGKELNQYTTNALTPERLNNSHVPEYFQYCTGFTYVQFNSLCEFFKIPNDPITPQTNIPLSYNIPDIEIQKLPLRSQFLLTLMKLRQNVDHKDLAFRFQICVQSVSNLIDSWVDYMYDRLGQLSVWPHRDVISQNMPLKFKEEFPNTFAILDCTELKTEKPSSLLLQSQTYSTYRSSNTLKSLVACDPRGAVIYVSALFTGSISDKEIFNRCNIRELLQGCIQCGYLKIGDALMTDKGFLIEKEVEEIGLRLNIPPFARSNRQMPHADVEMAKHRVQVERAIAKIKKFKIVSGRIPISQLYNINQIWYVVSMLSNFQPHRIKEQ